MGTPLGPKYIPYIYMDPLGLVFSRAWTLALWDEIGQGPPFQYQITMGLKGARVDIQHPSYMTLGLGRRPNLPYFHIS